MKTLTIGGTEYPVKYGRSALIDVNKLTGGSGLSDLSKLDSLSPEKWGDFVLAGIKNGCKLQKIDPPNISEVNFELDSNPTLYIDAITILGDDMKPRESPVAEGN